MKVNDWYFVPIKGPLPTSRLGNIETIGSLVKVVKVLDNPNYVDTEEWWVTTDRKFEYKGILEGMDSVILTKFSKKISAPPKVFEVLYSNSVDKNLDIENIVDNEIDNSDNESA